MKRFRVLVTVVTSIACVVACVIGCFIVSPAAASPRVDVTYVDPDKFTDVRNGYTQSPSARASYLAELERFVQSRAAARMADGDALAITITNVQLEGVYEARRPASTNVRIVRDVNPARIELSFRLVRGGTAREGERLLRTTGYPVVVGVDPGDPLLYVKALLDEWLRDEIAQPEAR